ncbi:restriction endonuclease subunit S [Streptomyces sp. NPDC127039]|uniref:restriction endonuclease subunit S n=1 Tax=Streptomyces sp. NPDC127039 TaxID=3347115 RepID=UPI0036492C94
MTWVEVPFLQALRDVSGGNAKVPKSDFRDSGVLPVVDQGQEKIAGYVDDLDLAQCNELPVIVFGDHTRCFKYIDFPFALGADGVKVLAAADGFDPRYLFWFLTSLDIPSAGYSRHYKYLKEFSVAKPPLAEQERIVAVLDQVESLRAKRREAIVLLDDLAQSIFLDMFGNPATNPKDVPVVKISDISRVGTGATPRRDDRSNYGGGIPWVKTGEVSGGVIQETEESISEPALSGSNCQVYPTGSIVVAMYGQGKTRGQCARLGVPAATNQACAVLQPGSQVDGEFLFRQLLFSYDRLRGLGRGGNQENLNLALVREFPVLLPHLDEQREYVRAIAEMEAMRDRYVTHLATLDELFTSLQHRAFSGTLWDHEVTGDAA